MLLLAESDIREALATIDPVATVRDAVKLHGEHRCVVAPEATMYWDTTTGARARSLALPGRVTPHAPQQGIKIINACLGNAQRGLPRASGITCLFDDETARIVCLASAGALSAVRTACISMIAIELLALRPTSRLCVLGAGAQAEAHLQLILPRIDGPETLALFDTNREAALILKNRVEALTHDACCMVDATAEDAVCEADLIITVTTVTESYLKWEWLSPGALVVNVSLDDLERDVFLQADRLFVDDWGLVSGDRTRQLGRLFGEGAVVGLSDPDVGGARRIDGELGDAVVGRVPRRISNDDVIVVNPFGCGVFDVALLAAVREVAERGGLGQTIELEPSV
jgi:ornithine cyclodeaminase/alanine dehydrogenase-like protein (mu-crystallin family)